MRRIKDFLKMSTILVKIYCSKYTYLQYLLCVPPPPCVSVQNVYRTLLNIGTGGEKLIQRILSTTANFSENN